MNGLPTRAILFTALYSTLRKLLSLDKYQDDILRLSAERKGTREIAAWLETKGVHASHMTVATWLKKKKEERALSTQKVLAQEMPRVVTADLDRLEAIYNELDEKACAVVASWSHDTKLDLPPEKLAGRVSDYCKLKELQLKTVALRLQHAGAGKPNEEAGRAPTVVVLPKGVSFEEWQKIWKLSQK